MQPITEQDKVHEQWYAEARNMTLEKLPEFMTRILTEYVHDYGTICHALAASAIAATWAANKFPQAGITGFQAGAVMWEFIRHWISLDGPARLLKYHDALYPQYENHFSNTISKDTMDWLVEQAKERLARETEAHPEVEAHWESIAAGTPPFGMVIKED
jgi:hypothetical protein